MENKKEKIAAVVVTYNRKDLLKECLNALLNQTHPLDSIIIVNNASTDGTEEMLKEEYLNNPIFDYVNLEENLGGGGGFHYGMKRAYEKGFDWIWVMDDDAIPYKDAVEQLLSVTQCKKEVKVFCSKIVDGFNVGKEENVLELEKTNDIRFVGFGINSCVIRNVGLPRVDFFIYFDDQEYVDRIIKKGYKIWKICNSLIFHKDWQERESFFLLFNSIKLPRVSYWRFYYKIRNQLLRYSYFEIKKYMKLFWAIRDTLLYSLFDFNFFRFGWIAIIHGVLGITGKRVKPNI